MNPAPSLIVSPRSNLLFRAGLFTLLMSMLGAVIASVVHFNQAAPGFFDLLIPPVMAVAFGCTAIYLYRNPLNYRRAALIGYCLGMIALAVPAWYYPYFALQTDVRLVDILPPISSGVFPLMLAIAIFVRPPRPLLAAALSWLAVAPPILIYLAFHPAEMLSPRGHDLTMTLGPVMLLVVAYIAVHRRVDELAQALNAQQIELRTLAERDSLTGLYNRRALEQLWLQQQDIARKGVLLIDVDHFKLVNDNFGHPAGDAVLREIAARCASVVHDDDLLARWGGEEFLVLTKIGDANALTDLAERLRSAIAHEPMFDIGQVTISIGATLTLLGESNIASIQRADNALYRAKANGRNRVEYSVN